MIAEATFGFRSTHATAGCAMLSPASAASGSSLATAVSVLSFRKPLTVFAPPFSSLAREPAGSGCPALYLPVSTPGAIGDQTIWLSPSRSDAGTTCDSITRHSIEYCGWFETNGTFSSRAGSAVHSETAT